MVDPGSILGVIGASIAVTKEIITVIDLVIGCCTKNTPAAALWLSLLTGLRIEIIHAQDQLRLVKDEVEPLRVKQGSGADAANQKREKVQLDELIQALARQLKASEEELLTATNKFKQQGRFDLAMLEALGTKVRESTASIEIHRQELQTTRLRVHEARQSIINAFLLNCHDSQFPPHSSLEVINDLAKGFLWPKPFCRTIKPEEPVASGLLLCNESDPTLEELRKTIHKMGRDWVHEVRAAAANRHEGHYADRDAATHHGQRRINAVDVLEECRDIILVQLQSVFKAIIKDGAPFTPTHSQIAVRGQYALDEWSSICVAAERGIVIAVGGKMNAGKSSILNAMLGQSLLPTASKCTHYLFCGCYSLCSATRAGLHSSSMSPASCAWSDRAKSVNTVC